MMICIYSLINLLFDLAVTLFIKSTLGHFYLLVDKGELDTGEGDKSLLYLILKIFEGK